MSEYDAQLVSFERRLRELERELAESCGARPGRGRRRSTPPPPARRTAVVRAACRRRPRADWPPAAPPRAGRSSRRRATSSSRPQREPFDLSRLLGARTLALTGGIVSLLGIVFFFALAVQRGWIGPVARVSLGAVASALMLGAGWWLRRRFGETFAATAAAGVGIAGAYATLLAAAARYDLVSDPVALVLAAGIAAVATATALAWSDELLAGLGLVGAILAPLAVAVRDDRLATTGVAFALLMLAATIAVSLYRSWYPLLVVATAVRRRPGRGAARRRVRPRGRGARARDRALGARARDRRLRGAAPRAADAAGRLVRDRRLGVLRLRGRGRCTTTARSASRCCASALVERRARRGLLPPLARPRLAALGDGARARRGRDGAAALGRDADDRLGGRGGRARLARRARCASRASASPRSPGWRSPSCTRSPSTRRCRSLFHETAHPASGVPSLLALIAAAALDGPGSAPTSSASPARAGPRSPSTSMLHVRRQTRLVLFALAGLLAIEAASLTLLELVPSWDWGHVAVTGLWGAIAIGLMLAGLRLAGRGLGRRDGGARGALRRRLPLRRRALVLARRRRGDRAARGAALRARARPGLGRRRGHRRGARRRRRASASPATTSSGCSCSPSARSTSRSAPRSCAPRRDQSTLLWGIGLDARRRRGVAAARRLVARARALGRRRGGGAARPVRGAARLRRALAARPRARRDARDEATPLDLFTAQRHPGDGRAGRARGRRRRGGLRGCCAPGIATVVIWTASVVAVFAASLAILELAEALSGSVDTDFQRGHTAVSALWGLVGLALLYAGLVRRSRRFQLAGFAPLRPRAREALRLRPRVPQLGRPRALVPRGRRGADRGRLLLPAPRRRARAGRSIPARPARSPLAS